MTARWTGRTTARHPRPRAWEHSGRRARFGYAVSLTIVGVFMVMAAVAARDRHLVVASAASLVVVAFVLQIRVDWLRGARRNALSPHLAGARIFRSALLLRADDREFVAELGNAVCGVVGGVLAFYAVCTGELDLSFQEYSPRPVSPYAFVIVAAMCAAEAIRLSVRRGPALIVSSCGLVMDAGIGRRAELSWDEVAMIEPTAVPVEGSRRYGAWLRIGDGDRAPLRLDRVRLGAPVTFWLLDFYHRHPELRDELGDARVLGRLADGSLVEDAQRHV